MPKLNALEKELAKRLQPKIDVLSYCFDKQRAFIEDKAHFKAALTTRRSGKTSAIGIYLIKEALENPGCKILYIGLTKQSATNILYKDIFVPICKKFNIKFNPVLSKNIIEFGNGSIIFIIGMDSSPKEMDKVLGQKYKLAFLDEAQSYTQDTKALIYQSLAATVQDLQGTIVCTGTPTDNMNTFFYEITKQKGQRAPGWSVHSWSTFDNVAIQADGLTQAEKCRNQIEEFRITIPLFEETDWFQQQFEGKWIITNEAKVYRFDPIRNLINDTTILTNIMQDKSWHFCLGVDFGWTDASALCILAYHHLDPNVYIVHSEKHEHWDTTNLANRIHDLDKSYKFSKIVGDSAAAQSLQTLSRQHQIPIKPVDKSGKKRESISIMNADFITGRIKIDQSNCLGLVKELKELIWDPKKLADGEYVEMAKCLNHETDSMNYAYRSCKHYRAGEAPIKLDVNEKLDRMAMLDQQDKPEWSIYSNTSVFHQIDEDEILFKLKEYRDKKRS